MAVEVLDPWATLPLTPEHTQLLASSAIDPTVAQEAGVRSLERLEDVPSEFAHYGIAAIPSLLFPWRNVDGTATVPQIRPDEPINGAKYLFPKGATPVLATHPRHRSAVLTGRGPILLVEGTKQYLAAVSALPTPSSPDDVCAIGMAGCYGWSHDGAPVPDFWAVPWAGREVLVCLDADFASNPDVWDAAQRLHEYLEPHGVSGVRFLKVPGGGKTGLDDALATAPDRATFLRNLIRQAQPAKKALGKRPPQPRPFFEQSGTLKVEELANAVRDDTPIALDRSGRIAIYRDGVYRVSDWGYSGIVSKLLGNNFQPRHRSAVEEFEAGRLERDGRVLPEYQDEPILNVRNGLLDLRTGELRPHDPDFMSMAQIAVEWDPDAKCPTYEAWLESVIPEQADDLEEVVSTMLDPSTTPPKAGLLYGPSRSGKSTFIRLAEAVVGPEMCSPVTLHKLTTSEFAAAELYGRMLNTAADISSAHIEDISLFKMLTGEDLILGNRKYGKQFAFRNRALFLFSANELPTVGESSRAYLERIKPFRFGRSFAGAEDRSIEDRMQRELSGILTRWVRAFQRLRGRGAYAPTAPDVAEDFATQSNRVHAWVAQECRVVTEVPDDKEGGDGGAGGMRSVVPGAVVPQDCGTTKRQLRRWFELWANESGQRSMGERLFNNHLASIEGVVDVRLMPNKTRGVNIVLRQDGEDDDLEPPAAGPDTPPPPPPPAPAGPSSPTPDLEARRGPTITPGAPMAFDLETGSVDDLWSAGDDYIRLIGYQDGDDVVITTDVDEVLANLEAAGQVIGHNIFGFDLLALAHRHGLDIHTLAEKAVDTKLVAFLADPPPARMPSGQIGKHYSLDSCGERLLGVRKTADLKDLAKLHGGFDKIPVDDPDFRRYLERDVELTAKLAAKLPVDAYARREHRVAAIAAQISLNGFRVDTDLLAKRLAEGEETRRRHLERLVEEYGLPITRKDGSPSKAPQNTEEGREAIVRAFTRLGVEDFPRTTKGAWATGSDAMEAIRERYSDRPEVVELADIVQGLNGVRTVYQTIADNLVGDRVHPQIDMRQVSGRWSITKPGLTVMGKRAGRYHEREVFLPEPGHVIIAVDLSQVDARAIAAHSQDPEYIKLFEPGRDSHAEVARMVWGDPSRREDAKAIGHGWNYGMGLSGLMRAAGVDEDTALEFDEAMVRQFRGLVAWREEVREKAAEKDALLDNGFGRKMRPDPERAWTQGPALIGQGCARDILMEGLLRLPAELRPMLRAVVHDEVVLSAPADIAGDVEKAVVDALTFEWAPPGASLLVPIEAGVVGPHGPSWGHVYRKEP